MELRPKGVVRLLPVPAFFLLPAMAFAATGTSSLAWGIMSMNLFGGLALFLLGMEMMTDNLKAAAGTRMKDFLGKLTTNRFTGALTGAAVTAVIQSSSVTTVLVVGFVSAGLMTLSQSIGVIMGANIGTTITAQIVAFKVTKLAMVLIAVGFGMTFFGKLERTRQYGGIFLGLGLVFFGMSVMSEAMNPLRSYEPFLEFMTHMEKPLYGILVGGAFTALVQSSSATTGIVIVMASQGFISLPAGIALALGANVGTCVTAMLASLGKPRIAVRAAAVHVLFNVLGVMVWLGLIDQLAEWAASISPQQDHLVGMARLAAETPRQIANANTLFNVVNTTLFIGFTGPFGRLVTYLFPDRDTDESGPIISPRYLNDQLMDTPTMALNLARLEIGHLGEIVLKMLGDTRRALETRDLNLFREIEKQDDAADILHSQIQTYLNRVGKRELTKEESQEFFTLSHTADSLEAIGDILETDLSGLGLEMINENMTPSDTTLMLLDTMHDAVYQAVDGAVRAVCRNEQLAAQEVIALKSVINNLMKAAFQRQSESLAASSPEHVKTLRMEFEVTDRLKQIYTLSKRMVRLVVPKEV